MISHSYLVCAATTNHMGFYSLHLQNIHVYTCEGNSKVNVKFNFLLSCKKSLSVKTLKNTNLILSWKRAFWGQAPRPPFLAHSCPHKFLAADTAPLIKLIVKTAKTQSKCFREGSIFEDLQHFETMFSTEIFHTNRLLLQKATYTKVIDISKHTKFMQ